MWFKIQILPQCSPFATHKPRQSLLARCARPQPASSGSHSSPWCRGFPCTECVGSSPGPAASWTWPAACCTGGGCAGHLTPRPTDSGADTHRRGSRAGERGEFGRSLQETTRWDAGRVVRLVVFCLVSHYFWFEWIKLVVIPLKLQNRFRSYLKKNVNSG